MHRDFRKKARIVLIDDNYEHLMGVKELLNLEGCFDVVQTSTSVNTGVNMVKKHTKGNGQESDGIVEREAPIHRSNVMIIDPKTKKPTRIGHSIENDKKVRISKKSGEKLD